MDFTKMIWPSRSRQGPRKATAVEAQRSRAELKKKKRHIKNQRGKFQPRLSGNILFANLKLFLITIFIHHFHIYPAGTGK